MRQKTTGLINGRLDIAEEKTNELFEDSKRKYLKRNTENKNFLNE